MAMIATATATQNDAEYIHVLSADEMSQSIKLISGQNLRQLDHIDRHQEIDPKNWHWDEPPLCILFVSHRWKSDFYPDPEDHQIKALHFLLDAISDITSVYHRPLEERVQKVKTILQHGILQAACIVDYVMQLPTGRVSASEILSRIGIWIDYVCLPQRTRQGKDERTASEIAEFRKGLRLLPSLVATSNFILSIRTADDDYIQRAWCISELCLSSFKYHRNVVVLRQDILGQPIADELLQLDYGEDGQGSLRAATDRFRSWENADDFSKHHPSLSSCYSNLEISEEYRIKQYEERDQHGIGSYDRLDNPTWPTPFFTTGRVPRIFPNHSHYLMNVRMIVLMDPPKNVTLLVTKWSLLVGMNCYEVGDYLLSGLHILRSRLTGLLGFRMFFDDCLRRWSNKQPLVLSRRCVGEDGEFDAVGPLTYEWETDERVLGLHSQATQLWVQHHREHENNGQDMSGRRAVDAKYEILMQAFLRQISLLEHVYKRLPNLGIIDLSVVVSQAMDAAMIPCTGSKVTTGLVLLYTFCQMIYEIKGPQTHRIPTFLLLALERLTIRDDLFVSRVHEFECTFVTEMTEELKLHSEKHQAIADELLVQLAIAATEPPAAQPL